jgi:hypothetical protein
MTEEQELETRAEAERLALLPRADQLAVVAVHRRVIANPRLTVNARRQAEEHLAALERHLRRLNRKRQ